MSLAVGHHATHVVNVLIAVLGWIPGRILLEDLNYLSATVAIFQHTLLPLSDSEHPLCDRDTKTANRTGLTFRDQWSHRIHPPSPMTVTALVQANPEAQSESYSRGP
jgi:hypothetical protein